jgi:mRNA interferase HigB
MHVISEKKLREFWEQWPAAKEPLWGWYRVAKHAVWKSFADIRQTYPSADQLGRCTVFDIGGNKFRLIVVIHFNRGKLYIRHVMTHKEYDKGLWKGDC